ncbi:hypothetical protein ACFTWH_28365 [Streptomyces sp. NPDC057011]|uniref:hypothetical protein n=1 Tax=unclassified Streptomyces TaxID=2593676 RepID=UPI0036439C79
MIIDDDTRELLLAAARNNAEWCDAVCRGHGPGGAFSPGAWTSAHRTPPLYPDAVTLTPEASAEALLAGIDTGSPGGCSVKDSFAVLDLVPAGFEVLFEARWIHHPAPAAAPSRLEWSEVATAGELEAWEAAWDGEESTGLFHPALLGGDSRGNTGGNTGGNTDGDTGAGSGRDIVFLAGRAGDRIVAGAVANRTGSVVGVSNLFAHDDADADAAWAGALSGIAARWPGLPVVGYEHGDDLDAALRNGFTDLGPLRVWLRT